MEIVGLGFKLCKELPMLRFLKAGTLNDSSWVKVDSNFFSESAHDWNKVDKEVKSFKTADMISNIKTVLKATFSFFYYKILLAQMISNIKSI